jgi:predicted Zn-dependent protease
MVRSLRPRGPLALLLVSLLLLPGCSVNPATGKQQLNFFSEEEEIQMGQEADQEVRDSIGLYDSPQLQAYVESLGQKLAAQSERPNLPWHFAVVDDAAVNAFALPGGYVYVTRGLLTHLGSEAELTGVLGHEIGHVTARHGANQMSKQLLMAVGLGVAVLANPKLEGWAGLAELGLGVLFLKYSRDDERQADDLGLRYMARSGHDPRQMPEVFSVLAEVEKVEGAGRLPNWLSTHPDPGARRERMEQEVAALQGDFSQALVERDAYVRRLDGLVFGENPREGFFRDAVFLHPDLRFRLEFPAGWETANQRDAVSAADSAGDAMLQVSLSEKTTRDEAADALFTEEEGIERGRSWEKRIHGLPATWQRFSYKDDETDLRGTAAFVEHDGQVFQLLAFATADAWESNREAMEEALASFSRLDDPQALAVRPSRLRVVPLKKSMTLEQFAQAYPSAVPLPRLALINHCRPGETLPAGRLMKQVVEEKPR